ncbi:hypothetical protein F5884DRAFT_857990 [Xylogone sp. PMI_703]|nr:hypothetical protein F5884DRAFT_857990 [Xylogone sp. PMI_703]
MAREGTRSATGHSRPRIFSVPETAPPTKRRTATNTKAKGGAKKATAEKGTKPAGITKVKKAASTKKAPITAKAKAVAKKVEGGESDKKTTGTKKN